MENKPSAESFSTDRFKELTLESMKSTMFNYREEIK